jgi:hypothetical protein
MFLIVWSDLAFEKMANLIRFNPERKEEFAAALHEIAQQLSHKPGRRASRARTKCG